MSGNYALYYPTIEFQNYEWLWAASLLWDRIYRIVPRDYELNEPDNIRILCEPGEIGIPIHPDQYAPEIAEEFMARITNREWDALAFDTSISEDYDRLHQGKVDVRLRELIVAQGSFKDNNWLHVPQDFASLYMTYLARSICQRNGLAPLTETSAAWTGQTYFEFDGAVDWTTDLKLSHQLAVLVVRDFLPAGLLRIEPDAIVKFREKYRDERQRFLKAMSEAANRITVCSDPKVAEDLIYDLKCDIEDSLIDFRKATSVLGKVTATGLCSIALPIATEIAAIIFGSGLDATRLTITTASSTALGLVSGLMRYRHQKNAIYSCNSYSYLMAMEREWSGYGPDGNDYNYLLWRQIEEFIND